MRIKLSVLALALGLPAGVRAHDPARGLSLVWPSVQATAPSLIVSNRGLVFVDAVEGGSRLSLRCSEGYGASVSDLPGVFLADQGAITLGVYSGTSTTPDRGCTLEPSSGLSGDSLGTSVADPSAPSQLFVSSRSFQVPAGVFVSEDFGRTWSKRFTNRMDDYFDALLVAPSAPQRLYAAGRRADRVNNKVIYFTSVSLDAGKSWEDHALPTEIIPFVVHPKNADVLFAHEPTDSLKTIFRVLRSEDRGAHFVSVLEGVPKPTAVAVSEAGSTLWLGIGGQGGLYRSADDGRHFERVHADSVQSVTCLMQRQGRLWMCANMSPNTNGVWFSADEGASFEKMMVFADVTEPVHCEAGEPQALCARAWYDFDIELHPPEDDAGVDAGISADAAANGGGALDAGAEAEPDAEAEDPKETDAAALPEDKKKGSGCQTAASGRLNLSALALLLTAVALRRRRSSVY